MSEASSFSENLGRAYRLIFQPRRRERAANYLRWQRGLLGARIVRTYRLIAAPRRRERAVSHLRWPEITTNFSHRDLGEGDLEEVVASGLTRLFVSIDGATQETYGKYRVRGDLARVFGNMERLAAVKARLGTASPYVAYKMLLNRYNQHEVEAARQLATERDAEFLLNDRFWCPPEHRAEWQADSGASGPREHLIFSDTVDGPVSSFCRQLWDSVVVSANGDVYPCCLLHDPRHVVGNLVDQDIDEIRNGERMVKLRRWVADPDEADPTFDNGCVGCTSRWCSVAGRPRRSVAAAAPG